MAFGIWYVNTTYALTYIVYKIEMEDKKYVVNNLVASAPNVITTWYLCHTNLIYLLAISIML
jgi:hypothetical protein